MIAGMLILIMIVCDIPLTNVYADDVGYYTYTLYIPIFKQTGSDTGYYDYNEEGWW